MLKWSFMMTPKGTSDSFTELEFKCSKYKNPSLSCGDHAISRDHPSWWASGPQAHSKYKGVRKQTALFSPWFLLPFHLNAWERKLYVQSSINFIPSYRIRGWPRDGGPKRAYWWSSGPSVGSLTHFYQGQLTPRDRHCPPLCPPQESRWHSPLQRKEYYGDTRRTMF